MWQAQISIINENVAKIYNLVRFDRRLTIREIVDERDISFDAVLYILTHDLNIRGVSAKLS